MNKNINSLVSIVIPTYNRKSDLVRAIDSVLNQSYTNWELIIVDNNSNDGTLEYVNNFKGHKIKHILVNNNGLIAYSRNKGIENSTGEYIAFLDSDDWWDKEKLSKSIEYINQGFDVVYHDLYIVNNINKLYNLKITRSKDANFKVYEDLIFNGNYICNSSVVIRKDILNQISKLPENVELNSICDFQAWLTISKITNKFKRIPLVLGYYWIGGGNITNPKRTISSLKEFKNQYLSEFSPTWYNYALGRAYFQEGDLKSAIYYLNKIVFSFENLELYIKKFYMKFFIFFSK